MKKKRKFITIGHITNDTEPMPHLGGSVSYSAIAAHQLGYEAHIVTKCPSTHPYLEELKKKGIIVHRLSSKLSTITTFKNLYSPDGKRTQYVLEQQEKIMVSDFDTISSELLTDSIIVISPVIGEVDEKLFSYLSAYGFVSLAPQGYFRKVEGDTTVTHVQWRGCEEYVQDIQISILSEEDIQRNNQCDMKLFDRIKAHVPLTVLTQGERGATVYTKTETIQTPAFKLFAEETVDFTGAGDCFATRFILEYMQSRNIQKASKEACFYAAVKIMAIHGIGIDSIPSREDLNDFKMKNESRVEAYFKS